MVKVGGGGTELWRSTERILRLVREGHASTRRELASVTGLSRSTITQHVDILIEEGWIIEAGEAPSTGGRPATILKLNPDIGIVLAADIGLSRSRIAVLDPGLRPLAEAAADMDSAQDPETVLPWILDRFADVLAKAGRDESDVLGIGVGFPAPIEFSTGRPVRPPLGRRWDGYAIPRFIAGRYDVPVIVDNDANVMARGEHWAHHGDVDSLLFLKIGTGIAAGIVVGGQVYHGADGAAGDIGHVLVAGSDAHCRCGHTGCLEALAGGWAMAGQLGATDHSIANGRYVMRLVDEGDPTALRLVRKSGRAIGEVLATAVSLLNPGVIVLGGDIARAGDPLVASVREIIYGSALPLATRHLDIVVSRLAERAGVVGAGAMTIDHLLSAGRLNRIRVSSTAREEVTA